jgi:hypothetical protein
MSSNSKLVSSNHEYLKLANKVGDALSFVYNQVVLLLNMFITFGDALLPSPSDYDLLYYQLLLERKSLDVFIEQGASLAFHWLIRQLI